VQVWLRFDHHTEPDKRLDVGGANRTAKFDVAGVQVGFDVKPAGRLGDEIIVKVTETYDKPQDMDKAMDQVRVEMDPDRPPKAVRRLYFEKTIEHHFVYDASAGLKPETVDGYQVFLTPVPKIQADAVALPATESPMLIEIPRR
jgi:hypothetical protein